MIIKKFNNKTGQNYSILEVQMLMPDNKLIQSELKNRFDIKE